MASPAMFAEIASLAGDPSRAAMLHALMDGRALTAAELADVAGITPATASEHLARMTEAGLLSVEKQGRHKYCRLASVHVAQMVESIMRVALTTMPTSKQVHTGPRENALRTARTCYDHLAGIAGVSLHDRFMTLKWLSAGAKNGDNAYDLTSDGTRAFEALGIDLEATRTLRRRFACPCLDWSERRPHIGGALGAAFLKVALKRRWVVQHLDSRALDVTKAGRREMLTRFGLDV